jgi:peptidoglycan/LPS O-acetylase OafA/YrhL
MRKAPQPELEPRSVTGMDKRIPSLDGIRAIAIFLVLVLHISQHFRWPTYGTRPYDLLFGREGALWTGDGVGIFFVLSGFLITTLLVREFNKTGTLAIGPFYVRRAFRILPPLLAYLAFAFVFCLVERIPFGPQNFTSALFFYRDYHFANDLWLTQHTWSLSVEEQFYLVWPILLLVLLGYKGRSAAAWCAAVLIVITPVFRIAGSKLMPGLAHEELYMLHCRMDALMSGCFIALCVGLPKFEAFYKYVAKVWWILPLEFWGISPLLGHIVGITFRKSVGLTLDSMTIGFFILWTARNADHWVGRFLNCRFMVQAGVLSYSAYIWQTFFLHENNRTWSGRFPFSLVYIWMAAWISYKLVELPALALRERVMRRPKTAGPDLMTKRPEMASFV